MFTEAVATVPSQDDGYGKISAHTALRLKKREVVLPLEPLD